METKDSVGNILNDGDAVIISKTLNVKGISKNLKRRDKIKTFVLFSDPEILNVELIKVNWLLKLSLLRQR